MGATLRREFLPSAFFAAFAGCLALAVGCESSTDPGEPGSLEVAVTTTTELDDPPAGYGLRLNGDLREESLEPEDQVDLGEVEAGEHEVELTGLTVNCEVDNGPNPRTVEVPAGDRVRTEFQVVCVAPREQVIAFSRLDTGVWDIWVMDEDGSNQSNLTDDAATDIRPMTSRDGSRVAFQSNRDGSMDVWTMLIDGSGKQNVTSSDADDTQPTWFPDGERLAFASDREGSNDIWVMDADGGNVERLTDGDGDDLQPWVSPDGSQIAFTSDRDGTRDIYIMDADGSNMVNVTESDSDDSRPGWSPDGSRIVFFSDRSEPYDVWIMDADGSDPENLTDNPGSWDVEPAISLDGSRIAFNSDREGNPCEQNCGMWETNADIWIMDIDGSNPTNVTQSPDTHEEDAAWES